MRRRIREHLTQEVRERSLALSGEHIVDRCTEREDAFGHLAVAIGAADDRDRLGAQRLHPVEQRDTGRGLLEGRRAADDAVASRRDSGGDGVGPLLDLRLQTLELLEIDFDFVLVLLRGSIEVLQIVPLVQVGTWPS